MEFPQDLFVSRVNIPKLIRRLYTLVGNKWGDMTAIVDVDRDKYFYSWIFYLVDHPWHTVVQFETMETGMGMGVECDVDSILQFPSQHNSLYKKKYDFRIDLESYLLARFHFYWVESFGKDNSSQDEDDDLIDESYDQLIQEQTSLSGQILELQNEWIHSVCVHHLGLFSRVYQLQIHYATWLTKWNKYHSVEGHRANQNQNGNHNHNHNIDCMVCIRYFQIFATMITELNWFFVFKRGIEVRDGRLSSFYQQHLICLSHRQRIVSFFLHLLSSPGNEHPIRFGFGLELCHSVLPSFITHWIRHKPKYSERDDSRGDDNNEDDQIHEDDNNNDNDDDYNILDDENELVRYYYRNDPETWNQFCFQTKIRKLQDILLEGEDPLCYENPSVIPFPQDHNKDTFYEKFPLGRIIRKILFRYLCRYVVHSSGDDHQQFDNKDPTQSSLKWYLKPDILQTIDENPVGLFVLDHLHGIYLCDFGHGHGNTIRYYTNPMDCLVDYSIRYSKQYPNKPPLFPISKW